MSQAELELLLKRGAATHEPSVQTLALERQAKESRAVSEQHAHDHPYTPADAAYDFAGQQLAAVARQAETDLKASQLSDQHPLTGLEKQMSGSPQG